MNCDNCINEQRILSLEEDSRKNISQHKEFYNSHETHAIEEALTKERYSTILSTMQEMKADIAILKEKPSKKWDNLTAIVISCFATGIITFLLAKLLNT